MYNCRNHEYNKEIKTIRDYEKIDGYNKARLN